MKANHPMISDKGFASTDNIFFAAVEVTRMPMVVTDPRREDNPIVFANEAFMDLTGYAPDEVLGRNCRFLQGADTDRETVAELRRALEQRTSIATEILNYRKDGSAFWNALFTSPVFDRNGEVRYHFASQLDVTRWRDAEDALRQAQKMEAVGQLTGGIAHDFNNLLTVMLGNLEAAIDQASDTKQERRLQRAMEAAQRAERLTQQLLAFARKQRLDGRPTNINKLIHALDELLERTLGANVQIETRLSLDLWTARLDVVQAELAILNVLLNARDAMPEGGRVMIATANRQITAEAACDLGDVKPGAYVELSISDTGAGMSPEVLYRVMEPFFTTKEPGKGSGMGLATVYGFMRQSHGHIQIESQFGQGTKVHLYFPAVERDAAPAPTERPAAAIKGGNETVLIVEDNSDVLELAQGILGDFGYRVLTAADAQEGLVRLDGADRVDLLFSDLVMPGGMNGVALAHEARGRQPRLKVLLTTGYADRLNGGSDVARSGFELIGKPYRRSELARRVRTILDGPAGIS